MATTQVLFVILSDMDKNWYGLKPSPLNKDLARLFIADTNAIYFDGIVWVCDVMKEKIIRFQDKPYNLKLELPIEKKFSQLLPSTFIDRNVCLIFESTLNRVQYYISNQTSAIDSGILNAAPFRDALRLLKFKFKHTPD